MSYNGITNIWIIFENDLKEDVSEISQNIPRKILVHGSQVFRRIVHHHSPHRKKSNFL